jgi:hypothetical protein
MNTLKNNQYGITVQFSPYNVLSHNNFVDNSINAAGAGAASFWNKGSPSEGNYFSDYNGTDRYWGHYQNETGSDGIGENPYEISDYNRDYYPLMGLFSSFRTPYGFYSYVISNSTVTNFSCFEWNGTIRFQVSNMKPSQTAGFCRVSIPKGALSPPYIVKINDGTTPVIYLNDMLYDNGTHRWIYFSYPQSTHTITILATVVEEDTTPPNIEYVYQEPDNSNVQPTDIVKVYASVTDGQSGVKQVILNYTTGDGVWHAMAMTCLEGSVYNSTISPFPEGTHVTYAIQAEDNAGNSITTSGMGYTYQYMVIPESLTVLLTTAFLLVTVFVAIAQKRQKAAEK